MTNTKLENKSLPNAKIIVSKWSDLYGEFQTISIIQPSSSENGELNVQFLEDSNDHNLLGLTLGDNKFRLPPVIRESLPGGFASKILAAHDSNWYRSSEFEKMVALGNREMGAYRFVIKEDGPMDSSIVKTRETLNDLIGKVHIAVNKDSLNGLLNKENFYSLTATRGETPKIEYQDDEGHRWVVKTGHIQRGKINSTMAKAEYALLVMQSDLGIEAPDARLHTTPQGDVVLMTKRYDLDMPELLIKGTLSNHMHRKSQISLRSFSEAVGHDEAITSYADIVKLVQKNKLSDDNDTMILLKQALFDIATNNTGTTLDNINFISDMNQYRIAPSVGALPDPLNNRFILPITDKYQTQSSVKFDSDFINEVANEFGVTPFAVKKEILALAEVMQKAEEYLKFADCSDDEIQQVHPSFVSSSAFDYVLQSSQKNALEQQFNSTILTQESFSAKLDC